MTVKTLMMNKIMNVSLLKSFSGWLVCALIILISTNSAAQQVRLINTEFVSLPGQGVEVRMEFDSVPSTPNSYMIESPPRLVMDFNNISNAMENRSLTINTGVVDSVNFAQAQERLRVVTNLTGTATHDVELDGNVLVMRFQEAVNVSQRSVNRPSVNTPAIMQTQAFDGRTQIQSIDFQRLEGNKGRVIISMSNDRAAMEVNREGGNVILNLNDTVLASDLSSRLDVQDFATPLQFIDTISSGSGGTTILMRPSRESYDYMAYQTGNQLIVDFTPLTNQEEQLRTDNQFPFNGERIDLNFQNVEVRAVLQIIAEVADMNLVVSDNVSGTVTLRLKNVPWDHALDILLKSKGLDKREAGNVLMVGTASEIADRERIEAESQQQVQELAPLLTEFIQVDFRRASDMRSRLEEARLISERGFILADDQTNVLMIRETGRQLEEIRKTLRNFDVEVAQVLVEARLVTASAEFAKEIGVRWGGVANPGGNSFINGSGIDNEMFEATIGGEESFLPGMVDLGVANATSSIAVGYLGSRLLLAAELSALQSDNKVEIVSQPKVITTNGRPAIIKSGQEVSYTTTSNEGTNVEFKEVVLSLEVTPQINPGDRISLDLKVNQDSLDPNRFGNEILINKNQLETSVVVNDGDTIVLGGVFRNDISNETRKTPVLGDLPVLGGLFRYRAENERKRELLIFITPTMIRESLAIE